MKTLSFGEILWDVYPDAKHLGGAPLNFAAHLAKHKEVVYMLSCLGNDSYGENAIKQIKKWDVFTDYIIRDDKKSTGKCLVTLDEDKVPSYNLLDDVAYDYIKREQIPDDFDVLYFGTLSLRSKTNFDSVKKLASDYNFDNVFVDVNIRPPHYSKETVTFAAENATIIKISLEEMGVVASLLDMDNNYDYKLFSSELAQNFKNLKCIIITLGEEGAYALDCNTKEEFFSPSKKVKLKSTVGAGDSFSAAFLHKYLNKNDILTCLSHASKVAGFVVSQYEAVPDYDAEKI